MKRQCELSNVSKMISKRVFVISVILIYLVLLALYFSIARTPNLTKLIIKPTGVRFCCGDRERCTNDFIQQKFDKNFLQGEKPAFFLEKPECSSMTELTMNWKFTSVLVAFYFICSETIIQSFQDGDIEPENEFDNFYYTSNEYCLESDGDSHDVDWKVFICLSNLGRPWQPIRVICK